MNDDLFVQPLDKAEFEAASTEIKVLMLESKLDELFEKQAALAARLTEQP